MSLYISMKKDKIYADIYYKGEKIATIKVHKANRTTTSMIALDGEIDTTFKIVKVPQTIETIENVEINENIYNSEEYNK